MANPPNKAEQAPPVDCELLLAAFLADERAAMAPRDVLEKDKLAILEALARKLTPC